MRISGLSGSGLDIDGIVSETMQTYKVKVTEKEKEKALVELKQSMYQDIIDEGQKLYDKYFSLTAKNSLSLSSTYATVVFSSSNSDAVSVKGLAGAEVENYKVSVSQMASSASTTIASDSLTAGQSVTITMGELSKTFTLEGSKLESKELGEGTSFSIKVGNNSEEVIKGKNAIASITNSKGETIKYEGSSNKVTLDNVQFTLNSTTVDSSGIDTPVSLTGKTDVTQLKDTIVNFVNDYNKFIIDLNTKLSESRSKDFMPLTDEEKSEMSESEIKLWEDKVKKGLFRNDSDLTRIVNTMKNTMKSISSSTGLSLSDIGITPVNDYKTKNGTFTIDESKLIEALETNLEGVKELFTAEEKTTTLPNGSTYTSGGIVTSLSNTFKNEFVLSTQSTLIKKAGTKNSALNATMTKELSTRQTAIDKLNNALKDRENKLYKKYAALETALSNLYTQQNSIYSLLGM